jgi:predicted dehydrogenase
MPIRLAVAGLTHGHVWGLLEQWAAQPDVELVAVADTTPLLERARPRFQRAYTDWQAMLDAESPDVVLACADNRTSAAIAIEAMQRGAHAMVEKPMAADLADAERMLETARATDRVLMINWPTRWNPAIHALLERARSGAFGAVFEFRFSNSAFVQGTRVRARLAATRTSWSGCTTSSATARARWLTSPATAQ